jgi:hypothetical protein
MNNQGIPAPGRSQVVRVTMEPRTWTFFDAAPPAPPIITTPPVISPPVVVPTDPSLADLLLRMARVEDEVETLRSRLNAIENTVITLPPVPTHTTPTTARLFGLTIPIPPVPLTRL